MDALLRLIECADSACAACGECSMVTKLNETEDRASAAHRLRKSRRRPVMVDGEDVSRASITRRPMPNFAPYKIRSSKSPMWSYRIGALIWGLRWLYRRCPPINGRAALPLCIERRPGHYFGYACGDNAKTTAGDRSPSKTFTTIETMDQRPAPPRGHG